MNKVALTIALVATCVAAVFAIPAPRSIDWDACAARVANIEAAGNNGSHNIKSIANNDNPQVGSNIASKVDNSMATANATVQEVRRHVTNQTWTEPAARTHMSEIKGTLARLIGSLQSDLNQLSVNASDEIKGVVTTTFDIIEENEEAIYVILLPANETVTSTSASF